MNDETTKDSKNEQQRPVAQLSFEDDEMLGEFSESELIQLLASTSKSKFYKRIFFCFIFFSQY